MQFWDNGVVSVDVVPCRADCAVLADIPKAITEARASALKDLTNMLR